MSRMEMELPPLEERNGHGTAQQVADVMGCSRQMIQKMITNRELPYLVIGTGKRIPWAAVREYIAEHTVPAAQ